MEKQTKKVLEWIIFGSLIIISILSLSAFFYQYSYNSKIYPHVYAAGIDLSGKTKQQAATLLDKKYKSILEDEVEIKTRDASVKTKVKDTGLSVDLTKTTDDLYSIGRDSNFFISLKKSLETIWKEQTVSIEPKIDQEKYSNFLKIAVAQLNSDPQDASIKIENGELKLSNEKVGMSVDTNNLIDKILSLANDSSNKIIALDTKPIKANITTADYDTATSYANNLLSKKFTFNYEDKSYSPTKVEVGNWISFSNKDGKYGGSLNESNITAYLNKVAKNFEITKKDKRINALDNSVLEEGREGKYLDKKDAMAQIRNQLSQTQVVVALKTYTEAPGEVKVFPAEGLVPGRFQGKYIDIDLTLQKMCRIESTNIIDCFPVSSGKPGMATPTGTYTIFDKNPRHWSGQYSMWLPWWQQFKAGGYGIHELPETATWKEVPDHLGTPVSHGCVRLGVGPAELVYNWTEIGTPVYIHK